MTLGPSRRMPAAAVLTALVVIAASARPGGAQGVSVDTLLERIANEPNPQPFAMTADFAADFTLKTPTGVLTVHAGGTMLESRTAPGEPRRRKATVTRLDVPLLLRPFHNSIRKVITDLIEVEQRPSEFLPVQDVFVAEERGGGRYLLGGVRTDIVNDVMTKYGQQALLRDPAARRAIARWLWSPSQRGTIVRPGPGPYMLEAVVDESGLVHELRLFYDWGQVGNRITFVVVGGRPFWREVVSNTSSEVSGMGRVDGRMVLQVSNHCLNCQAR
ncbi:MAG: hypothetical protein QN131_05835 [Armatimonadota bacterium]|nr:hypothetical protein [Armatimonadota bacterium]